MFDSYKKSRRHNNQSLDESLDILLKNPSDKEIEVILQSLEKLPDISCHVGNMHIVIVRHPDAEYMVWVNGDDFVAEVTKDEVIDLLKNGETAALLNEPIYTSDAFDDELILPDDYDDIDLAELDFPEDD